MPLDSTDMSFIFSHEVMIFRVQQNLAKWSSRLSKRLFDIVGSLSIIIVLSPLLIYISRKVKKDGGPAIYGHERIGKGGRSFKCLKFRSMVINSKEVLDQLLNNDVEAKEEWERTFKLKNDPRITKIGHNALHQRIYALKDLKAECDDLIIKEYCGYWANLECNREIFSSRYAVYRYNYLGTVDIS